MCLCLSLSFANLIFRSETLPEQSRRISLIRRRHLLQGSVLSLSLSLSLSLVLVNLDLIFDEMVFSLDFRVALR